RRPPESSPPRRRSAVRRAMSARWSSRYFRRRSGSQPRSLLASGARSHRSRRCQIIESSLHATAPVRRAGELEAHLDACQSAAKHEIVEIAQVADAENAAGELPQARTPRHIEGLEDDLPQ